LQQIAIKSLIITTSYKKCLAIEKTIALKENGRPACGEWRRPGTLARAAGDPRPVEPVQVDPN
jgi:hypothetical protein